ncbi:hypothetical protein JD276_09950 [Leucobacter sp. CSA1]|uniref:Uncharacterized protein n=1 Tax=Leucobacter chromiisoli TaxID=2796471 RepID=A0A934UVY0_9MICO|nr:hypothetical protein [Leucobacter chromiisoli]MBK0419357.1 hypothetical protein [Leucobacter chromiisoli]
MRLGRLLAWAAGALVVALYAYAVVAAVGNMTGMLQSAENIGLGISGLGWALLVFGLALPPLVLGGALLVARRSDAWTRVLILATGLCVVGALQLTLTDLVSRVISPLSLFV